MRIAAQRMDGKRMDGNNVLCNIVMLAKKDFDAHTDMLKAWYAYKVLALVKKISKITLEMYWKNKCYKFSVQYFIL